MNNNSRTFVNLVIGLLIMGLILCNSFLTYKLYLTIELESIDRKNALSQLTDVNKLLENNNQKKYSLADELNNLKLQLKDLSSKVDDFTEKAKKISEAQEAQKINTDNLIQAKDALFQRVSSLENLFNEIK
ncbi:MAG: hypothetical protein ABIG56_05140 [Candidatus Omnitrophota bacterium]